MLKSQHWRHIALNISGMLLPMLAGLLVVPGLIQRLGTERFGVLSIAWVLVGYFGLLDLGLGRGLTQLLARQTTAEVAPAYRAAVARQVRRWMCSLGLAWTLLLLVLTPWFSHSGLRLPATLQTETMQGWICLALSVPLLLWASSSVGVLEAYSRFTAVNIVRVPMGAATFLAPWTVTHWSVHLGAVLGSLLAVRLLAALALHNLSRNHFSPADPLPPASSLHELMTFGGWLTISNIINPVLSYFDRFAIGVLLSASAVTHYTVPFDALTRLPALPSAMMGVFFPLLAQAHHTPSLLVPMVRAALRLLLLLWLPAILTCALLGPTLLDWWIGPQLAQASIGVWSWIAAGVLVNGFAQIPYTLLHSAGRTDITAKFHLLELIPYLLALYWALLHYGIAGAAAVWTLRVCVDTTLLFLGAIRQFPALRATPAPLKTTP
jgi:O-antigen/teichoic acid export membrane protein